MNQPILAGLAALFATAYAYTYAYLLVMLALIVTNTLSARYSMLQLVRARGCAIIVISRFAINMGG